MGRILMVLILGAGLGACCPQEDNWEDMEMAPPPGAAEAMAMIRAEYGEAFGGHPDSVTVRWVSERRIDEDGSAALGWSLDCDRIWVAASPRGVLLPPSETSLAHELAHCYAGHISHCGLFYDNSHSEEWIWGEAGLVEWMDAKLAAAGL